MMIDLPAHTQHAIRHIAHLQGMSLEQFVLTSVYEKALSLAYAPTPNAETQQAIDELISGQGVMFDDIDALMADLNHA